MPRVTAILGLSAYLLLPSTVFAGNDAPTVLPRLHLPKAAAAPRPLMVWQQAQASLVRPVMPPRQRQQRDSLVNGTLIGAAVGAGYGAFVLSGGDLDPVAQWMLVPSAAGIGAGVGLLIDALRP